MTAPVELGYAMQAPQSGKKPEGDNAPLGADSMAFLYGNPSTGKPGPDEADRRVVVEDIPALTLLSVGVRGNYTNAHLTAALKKLREWIAANPDRVRVVGPPRYLGYNSSFVPWFLRYGEVQLPIERLSGERDRFIHRVSSGGCGTLEE
jgi:hypothetical protein